MTLSSTKQEKIPRFTIKLRFFTLKLILPLVLVVLLSANYGNYYDSSNVVSYSNTTKDDHMIGQITKSQMQSHNAIVNRW